MEDNDEVWKKASVLCNVKAMVKVSMACNGELPLILEFVEI